MTDDPRMAVLLSLAPPDSLLRNAPKVEPPKGMVFWDAETAEAWDKQHQWPEDVRRGRNGER